METKQKSSEQKSNECIPKIVHDGKCVHEWQDLGFDPEGKGQVGCKKCPCGRYYDPKEYEFVDGEIRRLG